MTRLIYKSKPQAWTRMEQHSFDTNFSNKCKDKQHVLTHLQRTEAPAVHLQNRLLETQVKDTKCDLQLTALI